MNKVDKFYEIKNILQCPVCGKKIRFHAGGLVCKREHRFDISTKGYVNLLQSSKPLKGYDLKFFESRRRFFEKGYYDHIADAVVQCVLGQSLVDGDIMAGDFAAGNIATGDPAAGVRRNSGIVLDAGCGEGFYAQRLASCTDAQILAFDIASDAIKVAARGDKPIKWMVADITNIPVKDNSIDCILDVFTPANYGEFKRVLKDGGFVVKVIPGKNHMVQLREIAAEALRRKEYSAGEDVQDYFAEHFEVVSQTAASRTMTIGQEDLADLAAMTPLLFDVDKASLDLSSITEITVEGQILVGR